MKIRALQKKLRRIFWIPLYDWVAPRILLNRKSKISFHSSIVSCQSLLYIVGPKTKTLDNALRDIDLLKVYNKDIDVILLAHFDQSSHLDKKLFPHLFFYEADGKDRMSSEEEFFQKLSDLKPKVVVGRGAFMTSHVRRAVVKSGAEMRLFFGEGDFTPFATLVCRDNDVILDMLFPDLK